MKNTEEQSILDCVIYAIKRMDIKPDYLLFLGYYVDWIWESESILGIPVVYTDDMLHKNDDRDCPFYPVWKKRNNYFNDVCRFRRAYEDAPIEYQK